MNYSTVRQFYNSKTWHKVAKDYAKSKHGLCERCLKNGLIVPYDEVHHKKRLTKENINDPDITINWNNLECLCKKCHEEEHQADAKQRPYKRKDYQGKRQQPQRYVVDQKTGKVIILADTPL